MLLYEKSYNTYTLTYSWQCLNHLLLVSHYSEYVTATQLNLRCLDDDDIIIIIIIVVVVVVI
jgi:hypothetical protein